MDPGGQEALALGEGAALAFGHLLACAKVNLFKLRKVRAACRLYVRLDGWPVEVDEAATLAGVQAHSAWRAPAPRGR